MKVKFSTLMLGIATMLASCSNEDGLLGSVNEKGEVAVRISAALPTDGMITRADSETGGLRCYVQVLNADGGSVGISEMNGSSGSYSSTLYLEPNQQYSFLFWADNATGSAPTNLTNVSYTNGSTIAFAGNVERETWSTETVTVQLKHVVSRITLKTTGDLTTNTNSAVTVALPANSIYTSYNVQTGAPTGTAGSYTHTYDASSTFNGTEASPATVCDIYVLTNTTDNSTLTIGYNNHNQEVSNVPLAPNKHVTLQGDIAHIGLESVTFTATIDDNWNTPDNPSTF